MTFTPNAFRAQQESWKALIQLNLVRSIVVICEALTEDPAEIDLDIDNYLSLDPSVSPGYSIKAADSLIETNESEKRNGYPHPGCVTNPFHLARCHSSHLRTSDAEISPVPALSTDHHMLKMRLSPLLHIQTVLIEHLACQFDDPSQVGAQHVGIHAQKSPEFVVRSNSSLKGFLGKKHDTSDTARTHSRARLDVNEIDSILEACRDDMISLWKDPVVREFLRRRNIKLEEGPGSPPFSWVALASYHSNACHPGLYVHCLATKLPDRV